jgi:SAM-dependent methyltransferase
VDGQCQVLLCKKCGHLQTAEFTDTSDYYAEHYQILTDSDDEDDIYEVSGDGKVFRSDHQLRTILAKVDIPANASVLDYGCAKASTLRKMMERRPDIRSHLFDVSDDYLDFWRRFAAPDSWATMSLPREWKGKFDVAMSFFAFEHILDVPGALKGVELVLKPGGIFYFVVPNLFTNIADFVVIDHINHFTESSLRYALGHAGLAVLGIDTNAHRGAFVVMASKPRSGSARVEEEARVPAEQERAVQGIATFWRGLGTRIAAIEEQLGNHSRSAIYGAGFYGTYIGTCLRDLAKVECFIDQNPFLQGKKLFDKPVLPPHALPQQVDHVYVGLNPTIARNAMGSLDAWRGRKLNYSYLTD